MKKMIYGFGTCLFLFVLSTAFYSTYQVSRLKAQVRRMEDIRTEAVQQTGSGTADQGYYLMEENGYVQVYQGDRRTVFETTGISLESLPVKLQQEIREGKYLESELQLYGFLENYSS